MKLPWENGLQAPRGRRAVSPGLLQLTVSQGPRALWGDQPGLLRSATLRVWAALEALARSWPVCGPFVARL